MEEAKTSSGNCRISPKYQTDDLQNHFILQKERFLPYPRQSGRKPKPIPYETETLILIAHETYSLGPTLLEKKIEEEYKFHTPHNTIYWILLNHERVEPCIKKRKQRKWVR